MKEIEKRLFKMNPRGTEPSSRSARHWNWGNKRNAGAGEHPAGTWRGLRAAILAQAGGGARDNVNREVPLLNSYHFLLNEKQPVFQ